MLKEWKLNYRNKVATNWIKKGDYSPTTEPMVDVRLLSKKSKEWRLETYSLPYRRKFREFFTSRKLAEKRAKQIMRKY